MKFEVGIVLKVESFQEWAAMVNAVAETAISNVILHILLIF